MINVRLYQDKLKALSDYMNLFIAHKYCDWMRWQFYEDTGMLLARVEPSLPSFEDWWDENYWKYTIEIW